MSPTYKTGASISTEGLDDSLDSNKIITRSSHPISHAAAYAESYFRAMYRGNDDPWQYQSRWYEKRKRDICLAALPKLRYDNAIELGCGIGVLSELLARRCCALVSLDRNGQAVQLAKDRLAVFPHTKVIKGTMPDVLSTLKDALFEAHALPRRTPTHMPPYDLIVVSEVLYYLPTNDINAVIIWAEKNLAENGTLLFCHWRHAIKGFSMTGETVHKQSYNTLIVPKDDNAHGIINHQSRIIDHDFLLDIWQRSPKSVAMQENLI